MSDLNLKFVENVDVVDVKIKVSQKVLNMNFGFNLYLTAVLIYIWNQVNPIAGWNKLDLYDSFSKIIGPSKEIFTSNFICIYDYQCFVYFSNNLYIHSLFCSLYAAAYQVLVR